jgi:2-oxoglutarate ferredoxin oxidoreductase subunit beta
MSSAGQNVPAPGAVEASLSAASAATVVSDGSAAALCAATAPRNLTRKDFESDQDVRWCPGCGDYAILASVLRVLPDLGIPRENFVFLSGIGCSSRFPYYVNTYGFHTIHGRAPAIAAGLKIARPELSVWVATGDGDALSIGGNHLIHVLRRNLDINILMFNNRIYGLTKGQYSPTSELGKVTKSTPIGSVDHPFYPIALALGADATFVARSIDVEAKHLQEIIRRAHAHRGTSFVEILQNCNIFNDGAFANLTEKDVKADTQLVLEHGRPLVFGRNRDKGIRLGTGLRPEVVTLGNGVTERDLIVHDEHDPTLAYFLSRMRPPAYPTPIGIYHAVETPTYEAGMAEQIATARAKQGEGDLDALFEHGDTWTVS